MVAFIEIVASQTTGEGGEKRRLLTGGLAYGMPRKELTLSPRAPTNTPHGAWTVVVVDFAVVRTKESTRNIMIPILFYLFDYQDYFI